MAITSFPAPNGHDTAWHLWMVSSLHARYGQVWQYFAPDTYHCFSERHWTEEGAADVCDFLATSHAADHRWYQPFTQIGDADARADEPTPPINGKE